MRSLGILFKRLIEKYKNSDVIFKASVWFICVTIINNSISLLTQPFVNRILSVEEVGVYSVYQTWHSVISIIATFNLYCGVLEVLITKDKENSNQTVASLMALSICISVVFFGACFIFIKPIAALLLLKPRYLIVMAITIISEMIVQFWCVQKRFLYLYKQYSILMVIMFFVKAIMTIALCYFMPNDRVLGRTLGLCLPNVLVAIVLAVLIFKKAVIKKITIHWKKAVLFNLPLIPHYLSSILLSSSDKVMIQRFVGAEAVGLYSVAYTFAGLALIVFSAINNAYTPFAYNAIRGKNYKELSIKTKYIILLSVIFSLGLMFLAPEGILILGGESYLTSLEIVPILVVGIFFSSFYFIFSNVEFVYERTKFIFPITILGAGLNILTNWLLIPKFGYEVAAYTTLLSYIVVALCHYLVSLKIAKENIYPMGKILLYILLLIVGAMVAIFAYRIHRLVRYCILLIGIVVFTLMLKNSVKFDSNQEKQL